MLKPCPQIIALHTTCCAHLPSTVYGPTTGVACYCTEARLFIAIFGPGDGCTLRHCPALSATLGAGAYVPSASSGQDSAPGFHSRKLSGDRIVQITYFHSQHQVCSCFLILYILRSLQLPAFHTGPFPDAPMPVLLPVPLNAGNAEWQACPNDWYCHSMHGGGQFLSIRMYFCFKFIYHLNHGYEIF